MLTRGESVLHLCAAAALSAGMLGVGLGAVDRRARGRARPAWLVCGVMGFVMTLWVANVELQFDPGGNDLVIAAACVIAGVAVAVPLAVVGLRGRFVGDHPHCRRCAFDLTGRPAGSDACSECGADLAAAGAVTTGVRRRRPVPLVVAAFAAALSIAVGSVVVRDAIAGPDGFRAIAYRPTSWLIDDVRRPTPAMSGADPSALAAMRELSRRASARELDAADARRLTIAAAKMPPRSVIPEDALSLDAIVYDAWGNGLVDEATMRSFVRARARIVVRVASRARPRRVPFDVTMPDLWASTDGTLGRRPTTFWAVSMKDRADQIDGASVAADEIIGRTAGATPPPLWSSGEWEWHYKSTPFGYAYRPRTPLPVGRVTVRTRMTVTVTLNVVGAAPLVEDVSVDATAAVQIAPGERLPSDDGRGEWLTRADATISPSPRGSADPRPLFLDVRSHAPNTRFVGDVFARGPGGVERFLDEFVMAEGVGRVPLSEALPEDVTLVFRPDPERVEALQTPQPTYQHEFVIQPTRIEQRP